MRATRVTAVALALAAACGKDTITVHGRVVNHLGIPISGIPVVIDPGEHWPVYPDEDGRFTVTDVETPYDVELFSPPAGDLAYAIVVYQGLTRSDPTLTVWVLRGECLYSPCGAQIDGTLSGGTGFPQPDDHVARVAFGAQDLLAHVDASQDGTFGWDEAWYGRASIPGELHALQWQADAEGYPIAFTGYGARPGVVLSDGASLADQDIALGPVGTGEVSGSATLPAGHSLDLRTVGLRVGEHGYVPIVLESAPEPDFAYAVPEVAGARIAVRAEASSAAGDLAFASRSLVPGTSGVSLVLPTAPTLLQPADGATGVTPGTRFEWTAFPGGIHLFAMLKTDSPMSTVTVVTAGTSVSRAAQAYESGWPPEPDARYVWGVSASTLYPSVDAAAGGPVDLSPSAAVTGPAVYDLDFGAAISAPRELWTAPAPPP
jgi:hypothetical protein